MSKATWMASDLSTKPGAFRAQKRPVSVTVTFAKEAGRVHTLEGDVQHEKADAVLTGVAGEQWPVPRERFLATYDAVPPTQPGEDGTYRKKPAMVWALQVAAEMAVPLSGDRGTLHAKRGDVVVQYAPGDLAVINQRIFDATYWRM